MSLTNICSPRPPSGGIAGWAAQGRAGVTVKKMVSFPSSPYLSLCQRDTGLGSHSGVKGVGQPEGTAGPCDLGHQLFTD